MPMRLVDISLLLPAECRCLRLPRAARARGYGSPFRPAFFSEIFNN